MGCFASRKRLELLQTDGGLSERAARSEWRTGTECASECDWADRQRRGIIFSFFFKKKNKNKKKINLPTAGQTRSESHFLCIHTRTRTVNV
jgi:hypothetical protein